MGIGIFLHVLVFSTPQTFGTQPQEVKNAGKDGRHVLWEIFSISRPIIFPMGCDIVMKGNMGRSEKDLSLALVSLILENARIFPLLRQLQGQNIITQSPSSDS